MLITLCICTKTTRFILFGSKTLCKTTFHGPVAVTERGAHAKHPEGNGVYSYHNRFACECHAESIGMGDKRDAYPTEKPKDPTTTLEFQVHYEVSDRRTAHVGR